MGLGGPTYGKSITTDKKGDVYVTGYFQGIVDFDPGPNTFIMDGGYSGPAGGVPYIQKLDSAGNFIYAKHHTNSAFYLGPIITVDNAGNIYSTGYFENTKDFDFGPGVFNLQSNGEKDVYIQKIDASGNFLWARQMGGLDNDMGLGILTDSSNNVYVSGYFRETADFFHGPGSFNLSTLGYSDIFVIKVDPDGNFLWAKQSKSNAYDGASPKSIQIDNRNNLYLMGLFRDSVDFDPDNTSAYLISPNPQSILFTTKWKQDSCTNFAIIIDSVADVNCSVSGFASINPINGHAPYTYIWDIPTVGNDSFASIPSPGQYLVNVSDDRGCHAYTSVLVNGPTDPSGFDLNVDLITTNFQSGFPATLWLNAFNDGCLPVSGQVSLTMSSWVHVDSFSIIPDLINGDTLIWNFTNWNYDSGDFQPKLFVTVDTSATIGDTVCFTTLITPITGDSDTTNNVKRYCEEVRNAIDPNDKQVYPVGECDEGYILPDQLLTYTIRFQNTGNADAVNIFIIDSLTTHLDPQTVRILHQSHEPMITELLPGNILKFRFDNIFLPDSSSNEPESHGFVVFEVMPDSNLTYGTKIENEVGIYFDFNDPIYTNSVSNALVGTIPNVQTKLNETICEQAYTLNNETYTTSGEYIQTLTSEQGCDSVITLKLTIDTIDVSVEQQGILLSAKEPNANYQWISCDNELTPIGGETDQTFLSTVNGSYAVIISKLGCSDTSNCYMVSSVGIDPEFASQIKVFPSPATDFLTIDLGRPLPSGKIELISVRGKTLQSKTINNHQTLQMNLTPFPAGVFFVKITSQGKLATFKVMKE